MSELSPWRVISNESSLMMKSDSLNWEIKFYRVLIVFINFYRLLLTAKIEQLTG